MKKIIFILPILVVVAVVAFVSYKAVTNGYVRLNYPTFEKYPVHGIDISHHQDTIDWSAIDKQYTQFAFIKSTEGSTHKDTQFDRNWEEAKKQSIPTSAYHFFTFCTPGADQALHYINTVPNDSTSLPPTVDLEYGGNCMEANRLPNLNEEICDYISIIENYYNQRVIIYTTWEFYDKYIANKYPHNPIWIRDILSEPKLENNRRWLFWQYTNRGRLDGVKTLIDLNAFAGSIEQLVALKDTYISPAIESDSIK